MSTIGCPNSDVLQQVNHVWSILDELSQCDPNAYQKFIERQLKEGAEFNAPPKPDSCLRTEMQGLKKGVLYINVCGWKRVPAPKDPNQPVPVCGGKLETDTDGNREEYSVLDVAFSPLVLEEAQKNRREKDQVHLLAMSFAQQQHDLHLSQQYNVTRSKLKGSLEDMQRRLGPQQKLSRASTSTNHPGTASQTPASLLQQISSLREVEDQDNPTVQLTPGPKEPKTNLIQVISSNVTAQPQKPEYQLKIVSDASGMSRSVELSVELPKVSSMSECQLNISQDDVLLEVDDLYYLQVMLPEIVNEESASATFHKKQRRLTLKVSVL
ncbi:PIH1 domain-containing protein 2 [Aplochiton taeniatus]